MILDKIFYIKISVPLNAVKSAKSRRLTPFPVDKFGSKGSKRKKQEKQIVLHHSYVELTN